MPCGKPSRSRQASPRVFDALRSLNVRNRETQHETLRRIIESGQPLDDELADKLLALTGGSKELDRDLKVGGLIMLFIAPGMLLLGWGLSQLEAELWNVMLGVGGLIGAIGVGLMVASYVVKHTTPERYGPSYAAATLAFGIAQMLAPQVGGLIADATGSFTVVFALSAGFALSGAVAASRLPR